MGVNGVHLAGFDFQPELSRVWCEPLGLDHGGPSHLSRQLDDILVGSLRDQIIARLALVSPLLHKEPRGRDKIYALHEPEVNCISKG
jgi:hypothetical protein